MSDIPVSSLLQIFLFLLFPFVFASVARFFRISPLIGYIVSGLALGIIIPATSKEILNNVSFIGIILLLFTVGLEVNIQQLIQLKKLILVGGLLQILFTIAAIYLLDLLFSIPFLTSILIALAFCSSSTILVAKIIQEKGEEGTFIGELAIGILMLQDLAFIPLLIIFNSISSPSITFSTLIIDILFSLMKAGVIISLLFFVGRKIIPRIFDKIAHSRELLNLFIIVFIFFITYIFALLQIPILVGVFVAGILVGQTYEHHHIFSQIRPLRDLLGVVFFVFIGASINLLHIGPLLPKILVFTGIVMVLKFAIILFVFIRMRFHSKSAFSLSLLLFQVSENALILLFTAFHGKVINNDDYIFASTSILITLLCTPILVNNKEKLYYNVRRLIKKYVPMLENYINKTIDQDVSPIQGIEMSNHVVICGYGRIGNHVGRALMMAGIPFVAIDYNFNVVDKAKKQGVQIIYGDPSDIDILDFAEVDKAKILLTAVPERFSQETIILNAQKLNSKIIIISRAHHHVDGQRMLDLGVDVVIQPEFEASLSIIKKLLYTFKSSEDEILGHIKRIKMEQGII